MEGEVALFGREVNRGCQISRGRLVGKDWLDVRYGQQR